MNMQDIAAGCVESSEASMEPSHIFAHAGSLRTTKR